MTYDAAKIATFTVNAMDRLEPQARAQIEQAVADGGGFWHELRENEDGTVTIAIAGVDLVTVTARALAPADGRLDRN